MAADTVQRVLGRLATRKHGGKQGRKVIANCLIQSFASTSVWNIASDSVLLVMRWEASGDHRECAVATTHMSQLVFRRHCAAIDCCLAGLRCCLAAVVVVFCVFDIGRLNTLYLRL